MNELRDLVNGLGMTGTTTLSAPMLRLLQAILAHTEIDVDDQDIQFLNKGGAIVSIALLREAVAVVPPEVSTAQILAGMDNKAEAQLFRAHRAVKGTTRRRENVVEDPMAVRTRTQVPEPQLSPAGGNLVAADQPPQPISQFGRPVIERDDDPSHHPDDGHESPVANVSAADAKDQISRMVSREKLEQIAHHDERPTVQKAAKDRLESLGS